MNPKEETNNTFDQDVPNYSPKQLTIEIFSSLLCTTGICGNILTIYIILNFKTIRRASSYFLLLNWTVADLLCLVVNPSELKPLFILADDFIPSSFYCVFYNTSLCLQAAVVSFVALLSVDWVFEAYYKSTHEKFQKCCKIVAWLIWSHVVFGVVTETVFCTRRVHFRLLPYLLIFSLFFAFVLVAGLHIFRLIQKCRSTTSKGHPPLMLVLATIFAVVRIPAALSYFVEFHLMVDLILECVVFSYSLINLFLLCICNDDFLNGFKQLFKPFGHEGQEEEELEKGTDQIVGISFSEAAKDDNRKHKLTK